MIRGIVFDMDGLMFDTERLVLEAWQVAGGQAGYTVDSSLVVQTLGLNAEDTKRVFMDALGPAFDFYSVRNTRDAHVRSRIGREGVPVKPGLAALLNFLKTNGYKMTVATSSEKEKAMLYFENAGIADFFEGIVCGEMIARGKPEPDIYLKACEILGVAPCECIALEDSPAGVQSAYLAGMKPVMIPDLAVPDEATEAMLFAKLPALTHVIRLLHALGR